MNDYYGAILLSRFYLWMRLQGVFLCPSSLDESTNHELPVWHGHQTIASSSERDDNIANLQAVGLSRLCADKTTLYQTITGFQPSIGRHFVAFHTISTTDPEEPSKALPSCPRSNKVAA